ncbi:MAG TPA: methylated-DNA--[protein]-cysteine S-methyltransferase [Bordetella sp.]|uniref:methylated-DNA--[protein]-cysteine S-methyltransferase n=1 Tax=Bordetella sp. TaxID=28081 RepID=UPI002ED52023
MAALTFLLERSPTPLGEMLIVTDEQGLLRALDWGDHEADMHRLMRNQYRNSAVELRETRRASPAMQTMLAYFDGDITGIDKLLVLTGGTDFQRKVWAALREIPCGSTISYLELATRIGKPLAVRAVGMANGANPVSIVIPCHRVIGSNRTLTGYGGGLHRKRWLLEHESEYRQGRLI